MNVPQMMPEVERAGEVQIPAIRGPVAAPPSTPLSGADALMRLIERAIESPSFDVAKLKELLEVKERWEANEARKAFVAALAAFKAAPPTVIKNKHVGYESKRTSDKTDYDHATLDQVVSVIAPALSLHGLSHRWQTKQENGLITVTCILTHQLGHSEEVSLAAGADNSGSKNPIQAIGSTVTYLQRYTLLAITGLAAKDQDNDARSLGAAGTITPEQKEELVALMKETSADTKRFLDYLGVGSLDDIPALQFTIAKAALMQKKKAAPQ